MQTTTTTLQAIKTARDAQMVGSESRAGLSEPHLAYLAFTGEADHKMTVDCVRLNKWARLIADDPDLRELPINITPVSDKLMLACGASEVSFQNHGESRSRTFRDGHYIFEGIELLISGGVVTLKTIPDKAALAVTRKATARLKRLAILTKKKTRILQSIAGATDRLANETKSYKAASRHLRTHSLPNALAFARKIRAVKATLREIKSALIESPPAFFFGWMNDTDRNRYEHLHREYAKAVNRRDNYAPRRNWGRNVETERKNRRIAAGTAGYALERHVEDSFARYVGKNVYAAIWFYKSTPYALAHDRVKKFAKLKISIQANIQDYKQDLKLIQLGLDKLG